MGIKYVDAKRLRRILISGAIALKAQEEYLNELNVYPVPDGDTGSNMSMTLETMKKEIEENTTKKSSMQEVVDVVEEAVLMGARGNSGTILSQIITGFLRSIGDKKRLEISDLVIAFKSAKDVAYKAVDTPVEGTILTVIREVSDKAQEIKDSTDSLENMLEILTKTAKEAVDKTPDLLPKLKEAGVVDSGAMGLYYFFQGMSNALTELETITSIEVEENNFNNKINKTHKPEEITFKYCTEFIIRNSDFDTEHFKQEILKLGDSAVFAQTSKKFKIHVHTNNPGQALELAVKYGDLEKIKIENMKLQNEGLISSEIDQSKVFVNHKGNHSRYSYVIIADTIALKDEFLKLGADVVLLGGQSQNPSVQDILTAIASVTSDKKIILLPNNKNVITTANIAAEKTEKNVIVVSTKTMLEGYFYIKNYFETLNTLNKENKNNISIEITKAIRDTKVDNLSINKDDYIALVNTKIKHCNANLDSLVKEVIEEYNNDRVIDITVVEGSTKNKECKEYIKKYPKVKFIDGNQDNYIYYMYFEYIPENQPEIAIVSDSSSDISEEETLNLPIYLLPIRLESNGVQFKDGVNLDKSEFWNKLIKEDALFKSAQPSPKELTDLFTHIFRKGYKKILSLNLSANMSGTYRTVKMVINNMNKEKDIIAFNTELVSVPLGILVRGAAEKAKSRESIENILYWANKIKEKSKALIVVDSLKYLERGGRISKVSKTVGDFLNLKPILTISQGSIISEKKVFGENSAISYIEKYVNEISKKQSIYVYVGWGGLGTELDKLNHIISNIKNNPKVTILEQPKIIGPTVGTHSGPLYCVYVVPKLL